MRARKPLLFCAAAIVAALAICIVWKPVSYSEQLIRVQAEQELAHIDKAIVNEPLEVQAVLLDYAADNGLEPLACAVRRLVPDYCPCSLSFFMAIERLGAVHIVGPFMA